MSAIPVDIHPGAVTGPRPAPLGQRPTLTLVQGGLGSDARDSGARAVPGLQGRLRLTRRGRMLLAGFVAALALAISLVAGGAFASASAPSSGPRTITVQPGDTLSQIAAREMPGMPIGNAVVDLQVANQLTNAGVTAGDTLVIPAP